MESVTFSPREEIEFGEEAVPQGIVWCAIPFKPKCLFYLNCRGYVAIDSKRSWSFSCICCSFGCYSTYGSFAKLDWIWAQIFRTIRNIHLNSGYSVLCPEMESLTSENVAYIVDKVLQLMVQVCIVVYFVISVSNCFNFRYWF